MSQYKNARSTEKSLLTRLAAGAAAVVLALSVAACGGAPAATDGDAAGADANQEQQAALAVTVEIDATAGEGELSTHHLELTEGATAYDALVAAADDVNASDSEYGAAPSTSSRTVTW